MVMRLDSSEAGAVRVLWGDRELFRYVYLPADPQLESPRPYLHPVWTLDGDLVSLYRPHDHVWHKGIAWSLPNVGAANFWGGPTYLRGQGYRQLPNNGRMRHDRFVLLEAGATAYLEEELTWVTEPGEAWFWERRRIAALVVPERGAWLLAFETTMRNVSGAAVTIGSPTTEGRRDAGYGGLFWRGPRSFSGGRVVTPNGEGGDEYMGWRGPWMGFVGRHDGHGRSSTLVFRDHPTNLGHPTRWFVRSQPYACLCPAPFFSREHRLADGEALSLRYQVAIVDGEAGVVGCRALADLVEARDPLGVRR